MTILKKIADVTVSATRSVELGDEAVSDGATVIIEVIDPSDVHTTHFIPKLKKDVWYTAAGYDDAIPYQIEIESDNSVSISTDSTADFKIQIYQLG